MDMAKKVILFIIIYLTAIACKTNAYQITRYPLDEIAKVTANYGQYRNYGPNYMVHDGIDLGGGIKGKPVYPVAEGVIETIGWDKDGFGRYIIVKHDKVVPVYRTMYAHLIVPEVEFLEKDSRVYSSQLIGHVGNTGGKSTGPHLHFNIGSNVEPVNTINPILSGLKQPLYKGSITARKELLRCQVK